MNEKWITIYTFFDILEGQELEAILKDNNIPTKLISRQDSAFDGIFKQSIGLGIIQVRQDYVKKANEIAADFTKTRAEITEKTEEESKAFKEKIYKEVREKNKSLYSSIRIIAIIILIGLTLFIAKSLFMTEGVSNYKQLINRCKEAIRINPNNVTAYENLGFIFFQLGQFDKSIDYYKKAVEIKPDYHSYLSLGSVYLAGGNLERAISSLKKSIELNSKYELSYINLARAYEKMGEYQLSIANLEEVLKINPLSSSAYNTMSATYYYAKDFNKMLASALKVIELDPKTHYGYYNAGLACFNLKSYPEAINYFGKTIASEPNYAQAYFYLGLIYRNNGEKDLMRKQCNKLIKLNRRDLADKVEGIEYPSKLPFEF